MAYSNIPDTEIEPGKPGSSGLFTKMRDNPEAIAAGIDPAPKIASAAFADNTLHAAKLVDNTMIFSAKAKALDSAEVTWEILYITIFIVPKGIWTVSNANSGAGLNIRIFTGGEWVATDGVIDTGAVITSDGINVALYASTAQAGVQARKIF